MNYGKEELLIAIIKAIGSNTSLKEVDLSGNFKISVLYMYKSPFVLVNLCFVLSIKR